MRLLLVEDNADVSELVADYLQARGHQVRRAGDGETGLTLARAGGFDGIILDRMLPGLDGASLCARLREDLQDFTPILMLTALTESADKIHGLAVGADDYMTKPFELAELEARLLALDRRAKRPQATRRLAVADLEFDLDRQRASRGGRVLNLGPKHRSILELLMRNAHRVVSPVEIERQLWPGGEGSARTLRVHIHTLRSAIDRPGEPSLLHTIRGAGYRIGLLDET